MFFKLPMPVLQRAFVVLMSLALGELVPAAEVYVPEHDGEVLETLPRALLSSRTRIAALRAQLAGSPRDTQLASQIAKEYMRLNDENGDPRFLGYARAAIDNWWDHEDAPVEVLHVRAKLKEKDHQYRQAVKDLEQLLAKSPNDMQALIEISNIHRVLGDFKEAELACDRLRDFAGPVPVVLCEAPILAATGRAQRAYDMLIGLPQDTMEQLPSVVAWRFASLAEYARSLGKDAIAESHYRKGLAARPDSLHLIRGFGDLLLETESSNEALEILRPHTSDNGVLLRAAIAAKECGDERLAAEWRQELATRFQEIRLRGSQPHGRFESRFALELEGDFERSLALATANWQKQKEFRDTLHLLRAALAAEKPSKATEAIEFLKTNRIDDVRLNAVVEKLKTLVDVE